MWLRLARGALQRREGYQAAKSIGYLTGQRVRLQHVAGSQSDRGIFSMRRDDDCLCGENAEGSVIIRRSSQRSGCT